MDKLKYIKLENEDGSYSSSIPLAVDSDHVDVNGTVLTEVINNKADIENVNFNINNLQSEINSLAKGSPLVASSTSEMTDTTRVYVNTSDGHWYYYNGTVWVDGGVYQAAEDSETVNCLESKTDELNNYINDIKYSLKWSIGNVTQTGVESENNKRIRSAIACADSDLHLIIDNPDIYNFSVVRFDDEQMTNPRFTWWVTEATLAAGIYYKVCVKRINETVINTSPMADSTFKNLHIYRKSELEYKNLKEKIRDVDNFKNNIMKKTYNLWNQNNDKNGRYINGEFQNNNSWLTSDFIPVEPNTLYKATFNEKNMAGLKVYAFDSDKKIIEEITTNNGEFTTGNNNVSYIRITISIEEQRLSTEKMLIKGNESKKYVPYYQISQMSMENSKKELELPDYFETKLSDAEVAIKAALNEAGVNKSAFIFFTDVHWGNNEKHSPAIIKRLLERTNLKYVICGGDVITGQDTKEKSLLELYNFQETFNFTRDYFFNVLGNHDTNNNSHDQDEEELTQSEMYASIFSQSESAFEVWGKNFCYYVDNTAEKTRYLFCDTGWFRKWTKERIDFMAEALNSLEEGWNCVFITHVLYTSGTTIAPFVQVILDMLDNYNLRKSHIISYSDYDFSVTEDGDIPYDFTNAKGEVRLVVGGHTHNDQTFVTNGGIRCLVMDCDSLGTTSGNPSTIGTVNEQCVTAIIADYENSKVSCIRIGRGSSATYNL